MKIQMSSEIDILRVSAFMLPITFAVMFSGLLVILSSLFQSDVLSSMNYGLCLFSASINYCVVFGPDVI
jgi:hypothetical protein